MRVEASTVGLINGVLPVPTRMIYNADKDPFAVQFVFMEPEAKKVTWTFGRDLLIEGLSLPSGIGDVKIRPEFDSIWVLIASPDGTANFKFRRGDIQDFVNRITYCVPRDREHELVNWDEELKVFEE